MNDRLITEEMLALSALRDSERQALRVACLSVPQDGLVVEVGSQLGCSSAIIAGAGRGKYRSIHIDPFRQDASYLPKWTSMMQQVSADPFTLLCMTTAQAAWHLEKLLADGIDLAYIDGDHSFEGISLDLVHVASQVKPGGMLVAHDYGHVQFPGVREALDEFCSSWECIGIYDSMGVWRRQ